MRTRGRIDEPKRKTVTPAQLTTLLKPAKCSKFNVDISLEGETARTYKGEVYDSLGEMQYAQYLDLRKKTKLIRGWVRQVDMPLIVCGIQIGNMRIDFVVTHNNDDLEYVEFKGAETELWRWKAKHLQAQWPNVKYTVVKK